MPIIEYNQFEKIFNDTIFEKSKANLLEKISTSPYRYIGLFRPTNPKAKIIQNLLQSHEICFGNAFETLIREYLRIKGFEILSRTFKNHKNKPLNIDQCFCKEDKVYFIEQKIRDDHDSTKKRGQILNFKDKLEMMISKYKKSELVGIFYFIDPDFKKNKKFYEQELLNMSKDYKKNDYKVKIEIFYGDSLFEYLGYKDIWKEILSYLTKWKKKIPNFPEVNFDINAQNTFDEIKDLSPSVFQKLFTQEEIFNEIVLTLFPKQKTLNLLYDYFSSKAETEYKKIANDLSNQKKFELKK